MGAEVTRSPKGHTTARIGKAGANVSAGLITMTRNKNTLDQMIESVCNHSTGAVQSLVDCLYDVDQGMTIHQIQDMFGKKQSLTLLKGLLHEAEKKGLIKFDINEKKYKSSKG
jgi:hypothetical protein